MLNKKVRRLESGGSFSQQRLVGVETKPIILASDVELFANVPSSIITQAKPLAWYNEDKGFTKELLVSIDEDSVFMRRELSKRSLSASGTSPKKEDY